MKAWYFDAYECTRCKIVRGWLSSISCEIEINSVRKSVDASLVATTFEQARTGRLKLIAGLIERKHHEIDLVQIDITTLLGLLNDAVRDDEGEHVDDEGDSS